MPYTTIKRIIDMGVSAAALLLLGPFLLVLATAIRLQSPGSPFFFQTRTGKNGVPFRIVKFRSMVQNAPMLGGWQTQDNDPRITRLGHWIRRTSLDELPQLWNVLVGEMSLVGPRPNTPQQESQYTPVQWQTRHAVRPGITGLAQVSGRSSLTVEEQIAYDCRYVEQVSLMLDIKIIAKTIAVALNRSGVN